MGILSGFNFCTGFVVVDGTGLSCCQTWSYAKCQPSAGRCQLSASSVRGFTTPTRKNAATRSGEEEEEAHAAAESKTESWRWKGAQRRPTRHETNKTSNGRCPTRQWAPVVAAAARLQPPPPSRWFRCMPLPPTTCIYIYKYTSKQQRRANKASGLTCMIVVERSRRPATISHGEHVVSFSLHFVLAALLTRRRCCVHGARHKQGLLPLFLRAVARLAECLATRPVSATAATVLYHAGALPRDPALERLVCDDMLGGDDDDCILHFVVGVMRTLG